MARTPIHTVTRDLRPLIRAAATSPVQFAVDIPYAVSTRSSGHWSVSGGRATWRYAVRVPTAVSLSFHAVHVRLPASAVLTVRGRSTTVLYRGGDLHGTGLWSRIQPGDALQFSLEVSQKQRAAVRLDIISLQAGYRSLGPGVQDQPYYRELRRKLVGTANSACVQNYECSVTSANSPAGQATVGLIVSNLYQCTGTLINDVPQNDAPYILTARHCESGSLGGGDPGAASNVTVYWDAVTPCGSPLGAIYDPGVKTQTGATTVVEQQDAWLIQLVDSPVVSDAELAGLDATGDAVQGGYTIQHALGMDKQLTTWFGTAYSTQEDGALGTSYVSNFWETVNATGNIGPGASGSGLFNQNNVLVGSLSLGREDSDSSGYEACPNPTLSPPDGSNGAADFTQLSAIWNSLADTTSSTSPATLQSVLDPADTGTQLIPGMPAASMTFSASTYSLSAGNRATLTWNAPGATQCTAEGGVAGDGWQGTLAASGSQQVSESAASEVGYRLVCQLPAARSLTSSLTITWGSPQPQLSFTGPTAAWTTTPATLSWTSNVSPCSINGGDLSVANLPSSGSITTTQATTGDVGYQIQCGTSSDSIAQTTVVSYVTPSVQFTANGTDRQLGQPLTLSWLTWAGSCTPSGGAPNDGWNTTNFGPQSPESGFSPNITTLGTYTYTLTCAAGKVTISKSLTVTVENDPAYVTLSVSPTTVTFSDSSADFVSLSWNSNLTNCTPDAQPRDGGFTVPAFTAQGTATWPPPPYPGPYTLTVTCDPYDTTTGSVTSTPVTVVVEPPPPPTATLSISPTTVQAGQNFLITWTAAHARNCIATGTSPPGFPWLDEQLLLSGSTTASVQSPGRYTLGIDCASIALTLPDATAQATVTVTQASPTAALSISSTAVQVGQSLTLTWSSTNATACSASGGGADGSPWSGSLATSGTSTQSVTTAGSFTYTVTCSEGNESSKAQATVTVSGASSGVSGGGGASGKGGGGAISDIDLLVLAAVFGFRRREELLKAAGRRFETLRGRHRQ